MNSILQRQRASFAAALPEPIAVRRERLDRAIAMLLESAEQLAAAATSTRRRSTMVASIRWVARWRTRR